jgi:ribonuclease-3
MFTSHRARLKRFHFYQRGLSRSSIFYPALALECRPNFPQTLTLLGVADYCTNMESNLTHFSINTLDPDRAAALDRLQGALGHRFGNNDLLLIALSHRSFVHQHGDGNNEIGLEDNQRLEFLGDAVLSLTVSTLLYHRFPDVREGMMSRMRAGLVNEMQLADMARQIGVDQALLLGRGEETTGGRDKNSILADAVEALVAAVYLDGGFKAAMDLVARLFEDLINRSDHDDLLKDFKTKFQEKTQALMGETPEYKLTGTSGPDHARIFEVTLTVAGKDVSKGRGHSKKEAEQAAAKAGLVVLKSETLQKTDITKP